jgi:hypothetical protein
MCCKTGTYLVLYSHIFASFFRKEWREGSTQMDYLIYSRVAVIISHITEERESHIALWNCNSNATLRFRTQVIWSRTIIRTASVELTCKRKKHSETNTGCLETKPLGKYSLRLTSRPLWLTNLSTLTLILQSLMQLYSSIFILVQHVSATLGHRQVLLPLLLKLPHCNFAFISLYMRTSSSTWCIVSLFAFNASTFRV